MKEGITVTPIGALKAEWVEKEGFTFYYSDSKLAPTIDFGTVKEGSEGTRMFRYTYSNSEDRITSVGASCGCTVPTLETDPFEENSQILKVSYDTNKVGEATKTVFIYSNGKKQSVKLKVNVQS